METISTRRQLETTTHTDKLTGRVEEIQVIMEYTIREANGQLIESRRGLHSSRTSSGREAIQAWIEATPEEEPETALTTYHGTRTDHLGFTHDSYTVAFWNCSFKVRRSTHQTHGTHFVISGSNDFGESYSVHPGTDLGQAILAHIPDNN